MTPITSKSYFQLLKIVHGALLFGQIAFAAFAIFLQSRGDFPADSEYARLFQYIAISLAIVGVGGGSIYQKIKLKAIKGNPDLKLKMNTYRIVFIIRAALIEGPSLFSIVGYLLTGNNFFLILFGGFILLFLLHIPTKVRLIEELELNSTEAALVKDPQAIVAEIAQ